MTDLRQAAQQALHELDSLLHALLLGIPFYRKYGVRVSNAITALRTALEQQQAEPVQERITHITWDERGVRTVNGIPDDAPQRQWVGLTDTDFLEACRIAERGNYLLALQRIQIKLKEKNSD